ncbi:hypothetical protein BLNAU_15201 [Blattamonas nauphoetae]|uniref:Uncharacterized protein n=1 Tax=Blattamonas nauphoetae TaxID=2049346 RepID=A0ABQ9XBJ6_9EUKA|nr:hypothetical protein BLNAU_15201 [Blattamonas nauphoetae]
MCFHSSIATAPPFLARHFLNDELSLLNEQFVAWNTAPSSSDVTFSIDEARNSMLVTEHSIIEHPVKMRPDEVEKSLGQNRVFLHCTGRTERFVEILTK